MTNGSGSIDVDGVTLTYSNTTNLVVHAPPGEQVSASLADIFEPPLYALQDFALGNMNGGNVTLLDISSGIDAVGSNISLSGGPAKAGVAWSMSDGSTITVPEHARTSNLKEAGVNFWVKFDSLPGNTSLLDWDDLGLRLIVTSDQRLQLEGSRAGVDYSATSTVTLQPQQWYRVAAHFYNGALRLGVNGNISTTPVGPELVAANSASYAVQFETSVGTQIAGLKIYNWQGEAKLTFGNGSFDSQVTADGTGKAKVALQAKPALLAYSRAFAVQDISFVAQVGNLLVPTAYGADAATEACISSFAPVSQDAIDPQIAQAERFMDIALECFVKKKVEEARINYQTSQGAFSRAVALVNQEMYEGVYSTLKVQRQSVLMFANCLDAVATGENASAVGATCDFITGMLAIGDIRDLLIQAWHYHVGDQSKYDPLVANLAAIGVIADGVQLIPGAQGGGVVLNAVTASAKQLVKFFKLIGAAGQRATKLLGTRMGKIVENDALTTEAKIASFNTMLPFFEISASIALIYEDDPRIFRFLAEAITSEHALDNLIGWTKRYLERLGNEIPLVDASPHSWMDFFISPAYADVSDPVRRRFIKELQDFLEMTGRLARIFHQTFEIGSLKPDAH